MITELSQVKYKKSKEGLYNAYIIINGSTYRVRAELVIIDHNGRVFCSVDKKHGELRYRLPGGGLEPGINPYQTAIKETMEEIRVIPKNVEYVTKYLISYEGKYKQWEKEKLWPIGLKYEGALTYVFVGRYDKPYKGFIKKIDRQDDMLETAKWVDIRKSIFKARPEHLKAITQGLKTWSETEEWGRYHGNPEERHISIYTKYMDSVIDRATTISQLK